MNLKKIVTCDMDKMKNPLSHTSGVGAGVCFIILFSSLFFYSTSIKWFTFFFCFLSIFSICAITYFKPKGYLVIIPGALAVVTVTSLVFYLNFMSLLYLYKTNDWLEFMNKLPYCYDSICLVLFVYCRVKIRNIKKEIMNNKIELETEGKKNK